MSSKTKNLKMAAERPGKKELDYDLVNGLKKDHNELSGLIGSFTNALTGSDLRQTRKVLCRIEDAAEKHFKFENNYLYPRMRRLLLVSLEKLCVEQQRIQDFIGKSQSLIKKNRLTKNGSAVLAETAFAISRHLKDCDGMILLADKFSNEEKNELDRKLKSCHGQDE